MPWELRYANGSTYSSADGEWVDARVDGVLWLVVNDHTVQGMDNYWMHNGHYGAFNDESNRDWYEGPMKSRWQIDPFVKVSRILPPSAAHVVRGELITDDAARKVGLI